MKAYVIINVARQVDGEIVLVRTEQGFTSKEKAQALLDATVRQQNQVLKTESGEIECFCIRGIYEVDIEVDRGQNMIAPPKVQTAMKPTNQGADLTPEELAKLKAFLNSR